MTIINQMRSKLLCINKSNLYLSSIIDTLKHIKVVKNVFRRYEERFSRKLDWKNPRRYSEKINLFQISQEAENLSNFVDKYEVRKYVTKQIGAEYLIPLLGVYNSVDEIQIDALPDSFVLKATHGSGWNIMCENKSELDWKKEKLKLAEWMHINYYRCYGERQYKNIKPRIICEKYIHSKDGLTDYKIHCFNGKPQFIRVFSGRFSSLKKSTYDLNWDKLPFTYLSHNGGQPYPEASMSKPNNLESMAQIASKLSSPFPYVRVDLYEVHNKVYFGELTFTPNAGRDIYYPDTYDEIYGSLLKFS